MGAKEELKRCGQALIEQGLTWGQSGNISLRIESDAFLISAGGTSLGNLGDEDIIRCETGKENCEGAAKPSMETGMHRGIYRKCEDARAIIHSQPLYSTVVACSGMPIRTDFLPEAMAYLERIERVPYRHAGSRELAEAATELADSSRVLLLENHGVICWGASLDEALLLTQALEFCCRLLVVAKSSGLDFNYLGEEVPADFRRHLREIGR
ncbi:MAG: class II aldolase/adducin family protein [Dehalococcoidia bacterium]